MATPEFTFQKQFPAGEDTTEYYLLSNEFVTSGCFEGREIVKVAGEGLTLLARRAIHDCSFMLRTPHLQQVAHILTDPEASENDRFVALTMLRNAEVAAGGELPFCQDTGTAVVLAKKGQQIWTGGGDEEAIARGIYQTYTEENLRYSQTIALDMYTEKNSGTNLPAQIDIYSTDGDQYNFLFIAKGGGSANKTSLFQETKALLNPARLESFLIDKLRSLGTAACPPYHVAFVIGGTSADACLKTVKLASAKYLDDLPVSGNEGGRAFRDIELEQKILKASHELGIGAQFGGKYFALDVRIIRLPRHGASCPVGMGVSCSADRNIKAKIDKQGIWIEKLEKDPGRFIPAKFREAGKGEPLSLIWISP
jgi:fumarate hydratase, class I